MNYADYLKDFYGIDHFIRPGKASTIAASVEEPLWLYNPAAPLKFIVLKEGAAHFSPQEKDLFEKMMGALKKKLTDLSLQVTTTLKTVETDNDVVVMSAHPTETLSLAQDLGLAISISTYDPQTLLKKPELKKEVWAQIQTLK
ncbi:MAG: hypothetical protein K2Q26_07860 [Bdellovibrionales bacterium]|nr:hypothetical protein [Bdellovibrionales bacterium]